jgi:hypothetical protein
MAASSEKTSYNEEKELELNEPTANEQIVRTKEEVIDHAGKEDILSQDSTTPEAESEAHDADDTEDDEHENGTNGTPVRPQSSRASSIFSRSQAVVPRAQRRGLFGRYTVIPEIERPHEYTTKTKWAITAIIALAAAAAPMGAGIFYRTL